MEVDMELEQEYLEQECIGTGAATRSVRSSVPRSCSTTGATIIWPRSRNKPLGGDFMGDNRLENVELDRLIGGYVARDSEGWAVNGCGMDICKQSLLQPRPVD